MQKMHIITWTEWCCLEGNLKCNLQKETGKPHIRWETKKGETHIVVEDTAVVVGERTRMITAVAVPAVVAQGVVAVDPTQNQNPAHRDAVNAPAAATETVTITVTVRERKNESDHSHAHHRVQDLGQPRVHAPHRPLQSSARKKTNKLLRVVHPVQTKYLISSKWDWENFRRACDH